MSELKITKERVLEAAKRSNLAESVFKSLFPEAFEDELVIDPEETLHIIKNGIRVQAIARRVFGEYANKGFYLSKGFNWKIVTDNKGIQVLVPTPKQ